MKQYKTLILFPTISLLSISLIFTILNLFYINISPIIYLLCINIIYIISGYLIASKYNNKLIYKSSIFSIISIFIFILLNIIITRSFSINNILFYLIIFLSTLVGTLFKANKKE